MTALLRNAHALTLTSGAPVHDQMYRVAGLLFASIVPAVFWMAIVGGVANAAGIDLTVATLTEVGVLVAACLGCVCAPIMLRGR